MTSRSRNVIVVGVALLAWWSVSERLRQAPAQAPAADTPQAAQGRQRATPPTDNLRLIDTRTTLQGFPQRQGQCTALVPQGWSFRSGQYGDSADLEGPGGTAHASWGILGRNMAMRSYYGPQFGPPEEATLAIASLVAKAQGQGQYTGAPQTIGDFFTARSFAAGNNIGTTLTHVFPAPAQNQYILAIYLAWVDRSAANLLPTAEAVMASISCTTQLRPSPQTGPLPRPGDTGHRTGNSETDSLQDYNAQLGSQWATSPSTGDHFLLDYATQWNSNGPDGAGYYRMAGNSLEKMNTGWK